MIWWSRLSGYLDRVEGPPPPPRPPPKPIAVERPARGGLPFELTRVQLDVFIGILRADVAADVTLNRPRYPVKADALAKLEVARQQKRSLDYVAVFFTKSEIDYARSNLKREYVRLVRDGEFKHVGRLDVLDRILARLRSVRHRENVRACVDAGVTASVGHS